MAQKRATSPNSTTPPSNTTDGPISLPEPNEQFDLEAFSTSEEGRKLVAWVQGEYERCSAARTTQATQWRENLMMFFGRQWAERSTSQLAGFRDQFVTPKKAAYKDRRTVNRTRAFVRAEHSKFLSSIPQAVAVPATADDEDVRAAYAAEQAWLSISERRKLRSHFTRASWWTITTGTGFIKTWWDNSIVPDPTNPASKGEVTFGSVTPFNLFVPDLREQDIEDQPYVITAYKKPLAWARATYGEQLKGIDLKPSSAGSNTILEEGVLNLSAGNKVLDSVTLYEAWIKPGATDLLKEGGLAIVIEDRLVALYREGLPYSHGQFPFTKFEHIPTATFYASSPLEDTNMLQKEYNEWRSRLGDYVKRMSAPQLLAAKGSVVPSKITNEPGLVVEYMPGMPPPQPMQLSPIPQYVMDQQGVILQDWEDITGQHEVSRGQAPAGVTAGTAIAYLQEKDDQYLTPQYQSIEDGYERAAVQALSLFNQYVDLPRKIKTVGSDGSFDTLLLSGKNIEAGLDIRIQRGTAQGQSQAAKAAQVMDMVAVGIIAPDQAARLLEVGGAQKVLDIINIAERKAMRENTKMKMMEPGVIEAHNAEWEQMISQMDLEADSDPANPLGPPDEVPPSPPLIPVDDFDLHDIHIEYHNKFRMGQEYEALPPEVKDQFAKHVAEHEQLKMQAQMKQFLDMIPSDGSDGGPLDGAAGGMEVATGNPAEPPSGDTMTPTEGAPASAPPMEGM